MKIIELSKGAGKLQVSDEDYQWAIQYPWFDNGQGYPATWMGDTQVTYPRLLLNIPVGLVVDHKDGNKLNNQRDNLRFATTAQNMQNRGKQRNNTTGFKGVFLKRAAPDEYQVRIMAKGIRYNIGSFNCRIKAAKAYNKAALQYHGEFACLNIIAEEVDE